MNNIKFNLGTFNISIILREFKMTMKYSIVLVEVNIQKYLTELMLFQIPKKC